MTVIAIDSDPGSDGDLIAATVATQLGLNLVDEACLLERLKNQDFDAPAAILSGEADRLVDPGPFSWRTLGAKLNLELLHLAQQDQILLHWPLAPLLLADIAHVARIKISAPLSVRTRRFAVRCGCNEQEARRKLQQYDEKIQFILNSCFGIQAPASAETYSVVADTAWLPAADWADEIVELARDAEFAPTTTSRAMLRWLLLQLSQSPSGPLLCDRGTSSPC